MDPHHVLQGDIDYVRDNIHLINKVYKGTIPLIAAIASEKRELIDFMLECPDIKVSTKIITPETNWSAELDTVFHFMAEYAVPLDICQRILEHPSFDPEVLNSVNHDDYAPLDLAVEYHPKLVPLMEAKGARRYWRVGPGFKPNPNECPG